MILNEDYFDNIPDIEDEEVTMDIVDTDTLHSLEDILHSEYKFYLEYQLIMMDYMTVGEIVDTVNKAQKHLEHYLNNSFYVEEVSNTIRESSRTDLKDYGFANTQELSDLFVVLDIGFTLKENLTHYQVLLFLWQLNNSLLFVKNIGNPRIKNRLYMNIIDSSKSLGYTSVIYFDYNKNKSFIDEHNPGEWYSIFTQLTGKFYILQVVKKVIKDFRAKWLKKS